jgi:hypothetical protein
VVTVRRHRVVTVQALAVVTAPRAMVPLVAVPVPKALKVAVKYSSVVANRAPSRVRTLRLLTIKM